MLKNRYWRLFLLFAAVLTASAVTFTDTDAIPYFGHSYELKCQSCHVVPPKLNLPGERVLAQGYRLVSAPRKKTIPASVWASARYEDRSALPEQRGLFNRIEIISAGSLAEGKLTYFVEWVPVSYQLQSSGRLLNRSGRFEDLWLSWNLPQNIGITAGQFRPVNQVDLSRRVSLSEPLPFSASIVGEKALDSRINSLRGFSPSGRSPGVRASVYLPKEDNLLQGLFAGVTVPFPGEFVIPLAEEVNDLAGFDLEGKPKGVFAEAFYRKGLSSGGVHGFVGEERWLVQVVGVGNYMRFFSTGAWGWFKDRTTKMRRASWDLEYFPFAWGGAGARVEDQSGPNTPLNWNSYLHLHFPGTTFTTRLTIERRWQGVTRQWLLELGLVI